MCRAPKNMHVVASKARRWPLAPLCSAILRDSKAVRRRLLLCAGGGGCSSCVVLPRLLEVHSVAHVAEVGPPEDCSVAGGPEHATGAAQCGKGKYTQERRLVPPCRRPSWIWRACVPENGRDGRLDTGVEISGSGNVSADGWAAWELTAAPVPVGIGRYVLM